MNNPPIIKPKNYAVGGPVLRPAAIQQDLNSLTEELRRVSKTDKEAGVKESIQETNDERQEFEDIEDFKKWIKNNTESDKETGEVFFIKPKTKEKVPVSGSPETNVLLYEVYKEQTGRTGDALDAIVDMDIRQFQVSPTQSKDFGSELERVRQGSTVGDAESKAGFSSVPFDGSVVGTVQKRMAMSDLARSQATREDESNRQFMAYREPGQNEYSLTPEPITPNEAAALGYEFAPAELAKEVNPAKGDFLETAILAGRLPKDVTSAFFKDRYGLDVDSNLSEEQQLDNALKQVELLKETQSLIGGDSKGPTEFKRFVDAKLPGLYTRGTKDPLSYKLEVHVKPGGGVQYRPSPDVDGVFADIYNAVQYTNDSKEEIELAKQLINPSGFGVVPNTQNIINKLLANVSGVDVNASDSEKLRRWAKNFTAKNITTILGESNRTISDADRKRADAIVAIDSGNWEDIGSARNALNELIPIFERPGKNAETAYQALMNAGESYGFLDKLIDTEQRLFDKRKRGKGLTAMPQSSQILFGEIDEVPVGKSTDFEFDFTQ
tara:strand:+ start:531 stop:2186 length:1656 start_codon:yes stop_codon:yes gene_type:complete